MDLGQRGKSKPLRVFGVSAFQFLKLGSGHRVPNNGVRDCWGKYGYWLCGKYVRVVGDPRRVNC
jgi:hypothetical protein